MSPTVRWLAAGAAAVVLAGVGFAAMSRPSNTGPGAPTPSPSAAATPSASPTATSSGLAALVPDEIRAHVWVSAPREIEALQTGAALFGLEFRFAGLQFHTGSTTILRSDARAPEDGVLEFTSIESTGGCAVGDIGRYAWSLTPGGGRLTLRLLEDDCAGRAGAVPAIWQRAACRESENWCLGVLEPGSYESQYVRPDITAEATWAPKYGAVSYTVPAGWANSDDWPNLYGIMRASSYEAGGLSEGAVTPDVITLLAHPAAARLQGCAEEPEQGVGTSVDELVGWLGAHPGLVVDEQPDITLSGRQAKVLHLAVADDWTSTCDSVNPFVAAPLFVGDYHWAIGKGDRMRVILLEVVAGEAVAITINPEDPATFDELVVEAMPIIESFDFK